MNKLFSWLYEKEKQVQIVWTWKKSDDSGFKKLSVYITVNQLRSWWNNNVVIESHVVMGFNSDYGYKEWNYMNNLSKNLCNSFKNLYELNEELILEVCRLGLPMEDKNFKLSLLTGMGFEKKMACQESGEKNMDGQTAAQNKELIAPAGDDTPLDLYPTRKHVRLTSEKVQELIIKPIGVNEESLKK